MAALQYEWNGKKNELTLSPEKEFWIGRDAICAVCLADVPKVSRRHCVVFFNTMTRRYSIADMNSTNGTCLNKVPIGRQNMSLKNGDVIQVGPVSLSYYEKDAVPEVSTHSTKIKAFLNIPLNHNAAKEKDDFFLHPGSRFGGSVITETLAENDFCIAFQLCDIHDADKRHVLWVFKNLPSDLSAGKELNSVVTHLPQNITGLQPIMDSGSLDSGHSFFITDFMELPSFAQLITISAPRSTARTMPLIYSVAMILNEALKHGIFHGFLTPNHILYSPRLGNRVIAMGISSWVRKYYSDLISCRGMWYTCPEFFAGRELTWQSDLYSLGIIMFQLLTGVLPFRSDSPAELANMHQNVPLPHTKERNPQVVIPHALETVLIRMTMKEPSQRYASWKALLSDLQKINSQLNNINSTEIFPSVNQGK